MGFCSYIMTIQMHAGIAEVAAAKARMFVNKPDGSKSFHVVNKHYYSEIIGLIREDWGGVRI